MKEIIAYVVPGLVVYAFVLVPLLMGLALNKKKHRDDAGKLNFCKDSLILRRVYFGGNFFEEVMECQKCTEDKMPKNICRLYWGIFWGVPIKTPVNILGVLIFFLWHAGAIFFGFWPKGHWKFHPYKKCGWNSEQKTLLLPWEIAIFFLAMLTIANLDSAINIVKQAIYNPTIRLIGDIVIGILVIVLLIVILSGIIILCARLENKYAAPFAELIKAKKQKWCTRINVE
jgi:hypothetical protein